MFLWEGCEPHFFVISCALVYLVEIRYVCPLLEIEFRFLFNSTYFRKVVFNSQNTILIMSKVERVLNWPG